MSIDSYSTFTVVRESHRTPPALTFVGGQLCPLDLCHAPLQENATGWTCTKCPARWTDFKGAHGSWDEDKVLALAREAGVVVEPTHEPSVGPLLGGLIGCGVIAAALVGMVNTLDERLVWWLAAAIGAVTVAYVATGWLSRVIADWPYRHNRVLGPVDGEVTR